MLQNSKRFFYPDPKGPKGLSKESLDFSEEKNQEARKSIISFSFISFMHLKCFFGHSANPSFEHGRQDRFFTSDF